MGELPTSLSHHACIRDLSVGPKMCRGQERALSAPRRGFSTAVEISRGTARQLSPLMARNGPTAFAGKRPLIGMKQT
jgi:hypothetical protein